MHNSAIACTSQTCASKSNLYKGLLAFYVAKTIKKVALFTILVLIAQKLG
jgi:hypothetical protein